MPFYSVADRRPSLYSHYKKKLSAAILSISDHGPTTIRRRPTSTMIWPELMPRLAQIPELQIC